MNPGKYKFKFDFEPLDLNDISKYANAIDVQNLQTILKDYYSVEKDLEEENMVVKKY